MKLSFCPRFCSRSLALDGCEFHPEHHKPSSWLLSYFFWKNTKLVGPVLWQQLHAHGSCWSQHFKSQSQNTDLQAFLMLPLPVQCATGSLPTQQPCYSDPALLMPEQQINSTAFATVRHRHLCHPLYPLISQNLHGTFRQEKEKKNPSTVAAGSRLGSKALLCTGSKIKCPKWEGQESEIGSSGSPVCMEHNTCCSSYSSVGLSTAKATYQATPA